MVKLVLIIVGVLLMVGLGIFISFQQAPKAPSSAPLAGQSEPTESNARQVPNLTLTDYNQKPVTLINFIGKPLVINSWAAWCPFCAKELRDFADIQQEFKDQVVIIAVDRTESLGVAKKFTDKLGVTDRLIFLLDPNDSFYQAIGGFAMPETIFVDGKGNIIEHKRGPMNQVEIRQKVQKLLRL